MSSNNEMNPEELLLVRQVIDQVLKASGATRAEAASELSGIAIKRRRGIGPRGSLEQAATCEFREKEQEARLIECLGDPNKEVRSKVALALGEWGGEQSAREVAWLLQSEQDEDVQLYYVETLKTIGGPSASQGLRWLLESGSDRLQAAAIYAVENLKAGGRMEDTEGVGSGEIASVPPKTSILVAGRARSRRGRVSPVGGSLRAYEKVYENANDGIVTALKRVSADERSSRYLRLRADEVLRLFNS